jgi:high-affinity iron transporter
MLGALIIVFREVIEAGLIVGIVLAVTRGVAGRGLWVAGGVAAGLFGAALIAVFAGALANAFAGFGQEIFNASVLAVIFFATRTASGPRIRQKLDAGHSAG